MRNSLKAVVFSALSVMFSAGLHAETHQHGEMNAAGDASAQQIIKGTGLSKTLTSAVRKSRFLTKPSRRLAGLL